MLGLCVCACVRVFVSLSLDNEASGGQRSRGPDPYSQSTPKWGRFDQHSPIEYQALINHLTKQKAKLDMENQPRAGYW